MWNDSATVDAATTVDHGSSPPRRIHTAQDLIHDVGLLLGETGLVTRSIIVRRSYGGMSPLLEPRVENRKV